MRMQVAIPLQQFAAAGPATHTCTAALTLPGGGDAAHLPHAAVSETKRRGPRSHVASGSGRLPPSLSIMSTRSGAPHRRTGDLDGPADDGAALQPTGASRRFEAQAARKRSRGVGTVKFRFNYFVDHRPSAGAPACPVTCAHAASREGRASCATCCG